MKWLTLFGVLGHSLLTVCCLSLALDSTHVNKVLREKCSGGNKYTMPCLKLDSLRLLLLLGNETYIHLGPGIALVGTEATATLIDELDATLKEPRSLNELDDFVFKMLRLYLGSLNLTFQMRDSHILDDAVSYLSPKSEVTGRQGTRLGGRLALAWFLLATIAAVGFAVLAALTGAGLTAAILALVLAAIASIKSNSTGGHHGGYGYGYGFAAPHFHSPTGRITSYEFLKPTYVPTGESQAGHYVVDHEHHHSSALMGAKRAGLVGSLTASDEPEPIRKK